MSTNQPDFQSLRNIRDNSLLLSVANEYLGENIYLAKIGTLLEKNLSVLKDDIRLLKKQFPGKFAVEVNTDKIMDSFDKTAIEMISGGNEVRAECVSGKLGAALFGDINEITDAIEKIWQQVKGSDVKYTKADSISGLFGRLNIFSGILKIFSNIAKILLIVIIIALAGFSYLYLTMEKEQTILDENSKITALIDNEKAQLADLEKKKAEARKRLKSYNDDELRTEKIAILDIESSIQEFNQQIHVIEGRIETRNRTLARNNERLREVKGKSFWKRLFKQ